MLWSHTERVTNSKRQFGTVERVKMKFVDAFALEVQERRDRLRSASDRELEESLLPLRRALHRAGLAHELLVESFALVR